MGAVLWRWEQGQMPAHPMPLIGGVLADHFGYPPVFIVSAITGVVAMLAFQFWVPGPRVRLSQAQP